MKDWCPFFFNENDSYRYLDISIEFLRCSCLFFIIFSCGKENLCKKFISTNKHSKYLLIYIRKTPNKKHCITGAETIKVGLIQNAWDVNGLPFYCAMVNTATICQSKWPSKRWTLTPWTKLSWSWRACWMNKIWKLCLVGLFKILVWLIINNLTF